MAQSVVIGLLFSDWSDSPVCCYWSTLLWLVRWPSLWWLVYSALVRWPSLVWLVYSVLIGQMEQSVVTGLLWLVRCPSLVWLVYSVLNGQLYYTLHGRYLENRSTLFWLVRWNSLLWLVYSDWSDGQVWCDWSTLLWLIRWPSLLWLVYSALVRWPSLVWLVYSVLIGQMAQFVVIGLLYFDWSDGPVCCDWSTLFWMVSDITHYMEDIWKSILVVLLCDLRWREWNLNSSVPFSRCAIWD